MISIVAKTSRNALFSSTRMLLTDAYIFLEHMVKNNLFYTSVMIYSKARVNIGGGYVGYSSHGIPLDFADSFAKGMLEFSGGQRIDEQ